MNKDEPLNNIQYNELLRMNESLKDENDRLACLLNAAECKINDLEDKTNLLERKMGSLWSMIDARLAAIDSRLAAFDIRFKKMEQLKELILYHDYN